MTALDIGWTILVTVTFVGFVWFTIKWWQAVKKSSR